MKRGIVLAVCLLTIISALAQNISVKTFRALPMDLSASSLEGKRVDQNGQVAALIKIVTPQTGFTFEGGALGIVDTKQENGEVWVWVPRALRKITIKHQQLGVLRDYMFPIEIEAERTYEMVLTTAKIVTSVEEEVRQQYLVFQINPPDAALEVDDQLWTVSAEGTARKFVNFGTYTYRVQAPNYHPDAGQVTVDDPVNKKTVTVTLQPNFGWIEVKGNNLQGASVYIDNALIGKAPCKSEFLKSGEHTVKIAKDMYAPYTERVIVSDNQTTTLSPILTADYAKVTLAVDADAEIWVNGEKKGTRSWTGDLASGTYRIECRQPNHEPTVLTKEIDNTMNGQTITLSSPIPVYGSLNVESNPDYAKIFVDGEPMGETPNFISKILIGQHELKLCKDGYADHIETVTVVKGERKQVNATMSNSLPIPEGAIPGPFSVSPTKKVFFSKGNLQYQPSNKKLRFAPSPWEIIGDANENVSPSYNGWIDLFCWGTGDNPAKNTHNNGDYAVFTDWGSKYGGGWRTLTKDEWAYVLEQRNTTSGIRYAKAIVNDVNGLIILPDYWHSSTYELNAANDDKAKFSSNKISASIWNDLFLSVGAVFLPAGGTRCNEKTILFSGDNGNYWSSTPGKNENCGYEMSFSNKSLSKFISAGGYDGYSVRLIHDLDESAKKMDWQSMSIPTPIYVTLDVKSVPDHAQVFVDNKPMGETPYFTSQLLIGRHDLRLMKRGYADYTESFVVEKGERKQVNVTLSKSKETAVAAQNAYMKILKVEFGNKYKDKLWIDTYGSDLYYSDVRYLMPKVTFDGLSDREREVTIDVKIFAPGKTTCENTSNPPENYTLSSQIKVNHEEGSVAYLKGWGNSTGNYFEVGTWTYELWYNGKQIYKTTFEIKPDNKRPKYDKLPDSKIIQTNAKYRYEIGRDKYFEALRNNTDQAEAERWYLESAEMGYCWAQANLADLYEEGTGVKKDEAAAAKWRRKAAEQGATLDWIRLGNMYFDGRGVKQDYSEAVKCYREVLLTKPEEDRYIPLAQNNLGWCYQNGFGVEKNIAEAVKYYRSSAEQDNCDGIGNMAYMYENGIGVKKDLEKAKELYLKVAKGGQCSTSVGGLGHGYDYARKHAKIYEE